MVTDERPGEWALVLGASSGFGRAVALELAALGMNIVGVHLDRKSTLPDVDRLVADIHALGRETLFFNVNAADAEKRREVVDAVEARFRAHGEGRRFACSFIPWPSERCDGSSPKRAPMP